MCSVVHEVKSDEEWSGAVKGIVDRIIALVKQRDIGKFEEALRKAYPFLEGMLEQVEKKKLVYNHFSKLFESLKR